MRRMNDFEHNMELLCQYFLRLDSGYVDCLIFEKLIAKVSYIDVD